MEKNSMPLLALLCRKLLSSEEPIATERASAFLDHLEGRRTSCLSEKENEFFRLGAALASSEWRQTSRSDPSFAEKSARLEAALKKGDRRYEAALREILVPSFEEDENQDAQIDSLRKRRTIRLTQLNPTPLDSPHQQILFTSNAMLSVPMGPVDHLPHPFRECLEDVCQNEKQEYWFDHPIPIGVPLFKNELLYGLKGLAAALRYEKNNKLAPQEATLTVLLSLSVTHRGLKRIAREYVNWELQREHASLEGLQVYLFTEDDTQQMAELLQTLLPNHEQKIARVFGVDGPYGRHYSFLKAIAALWPLTVDSKIKATFKMDLDQVFPQQELCQQSGKSALEHFKTPLWGAQGVDEEGHLVELGLIAGAVVNESDIGRSLFTPDVPFPPKGPLKGEKRVFPKQHLMALSTEAEMMSRYDGSPLDGKSNCLTRFHVTGGTNGILVDALRRWHPFTPTFLGRAEDQAYLMSALFSPSESGRLLRYLHAPGLIMRHDKAAFAGDIVESQKWGSYVGDLVRTLYFSSYAPLIAEVDSVKSLLDPFTGAFISPVPVTLIFLRLTTQLDELREQKKAAEELCSLAALRLMPLLKKYEEKKENFLKENLKADKLSWKAFYQSLETLEQEGSAQIKERLSAVIGSCRLAL